MKVEVEACDIKIAIGFFIGTSVGAAVVESTQLVSDDLFVLTLAFMAGVVVQRVIYLALIKYIAGDDGVGGDE